MDLLNQKTLKIGVAANKRSEPSGIMSRWSLGAKGRTHRRHSTDWTMSPKKQSKSNSSVKCHRVCHNRKELLVADTYIVFWWDGKAHGGHRTCPREKAGREQRNKTESFAIECAPLVYAPPIEFEGSKKQTNAFVSPHH